MKFLVRLEFAPIGERGADREQPGREIDLRPREVRFQDAGDRWRLPAHPRALARHHRERRRVRLQFGGIARFGHPIGKAARIRLLHGVRDFVGEDALPLP